MPMQIAENIYHKFVVLPPLFLSADADSLKLELKPYLQPFERLLALRELQALLNNNEQIREEHGLYIVKTDKSDEYFRHRLTYWQRVGRRYLAPTIQKSLEFTQNGIAKASSSSDLHSARRLRYGPHNLHEYRGKFFPQLVRSLVNMSGVSDDALILDPMCGSGTTPCEVIALSRSAIAADLNPLSVLISEVKSAIVAEQAEAFNKIVSKHVKGFRFRRKGDPSAVWSNDDLSYLERWFSPAALKDLANIIIEIRNIQDSLYRKLYQVCLSNIVRSVSWQKDTDLRVRKEKTTYISGTAISLFREEIRQQLDRIYPYLCVLPHPSRIPNLSIRQGNAVKVSDVFPEYLGKVDLLITSPPYATALPYIDTDRLSLIVLGLVPHKQHKVIESSMVGTREISERQRREEWERYINRRHELPKAVNRLIDQVAAFNHGDHVGFRRRNLPALLGKYYLDMLDSMRSAHLLMKKGARGYYVVGNNSTILNGQKLEIPTNEFLYEIGAAAGWRQDEMIPMELLASRDIFRENRGSAETILCFTA